MALIVPFRALRPTPASAARVAAVPYDVVNAGEAHALAAGNPLSFLHVSRAEIDLPQSILPPPSKEWEATFRNLRDSAARLFELTPDAPEQARMMIMNIESPEQLADFWRRTST